MSTYLAFFESPKLVLPASMVERPGGAAGGAVGPGAAEILPTPNLWNIGHDASFLGRTANLHLGAFRSRVFAGIRSGGPARRLIRARPTTLTVTSARRLPGSRPEGAREPGRVVGGNSSVKGGGHQEITIRNSPAMRRRPRLR